MFVWVDKVLAYVRTLPADVGLAILSSNRAFESMMLSGCAAALSSNFKIGERILKMAHSNN